MRNLYEGRIKLNSVIFKVRFIQIIFTIIVVCVNTTNIFSQQISINRVEIMPNIPSPFQMRDWKKIAIGYDSLVFDLNATGQYLPLSWLYSNTINYPNHQSFGIDSYVGWYSSGWGEGINCLAAVVGASLSGIDKSNQNGQNWVLYCEEFFNNRPQENVYLNQPVISSGNDWWYDTMPNIFFYQLGPKRNTILFCMVGNSSNTAISGLLPSFCQRLQTNIYQIF